MGESRRTLDRIKNNLQKLFVIRYSLFVIRYSLYLISIFLITFTPLNAQIKIKEKVEIKPETITPEYAAPLYTPCGPWITSYDRLNPWQVVWNSISFAPDPYQQMFNFQDNRYGPGLQRRTYTIDPNKYYNITLLQSDEYSYFTYGGFWDIDAGNYVPIQYVGTTLNGVLGSDLGAIAWFDYVRDYPNGLYHSYSNKYNLKIKRDVPPGTEIIMSVFDGQETINYHTRVETPTFTIENDTNEDTLLHNQSRDIEFFLNFQSGCQLGNYGGAYPTGIKFNVEIVQGQQYGNLYYPGTVADPEQTGTSITNLEDDYGGGICNYVIRYTADGVQPDTSTPAIVTIRCTANDADIAPAEVSFPIKYSDEPLPSIGGYILVDFNKDSFNPGDIATTNCKWLTAYNEILDFPGDQSFNAEIVSGKEYGMLLDPNNGTVSNILDGVSNGFKVITAASIPYDSVVIRIRVTTIAGDGGIIAAKIINNQNQNSGKKQSEEKGINTSTNSISSSLSIGNPGGMLIEGYGDVVLKRENEILLGETKYFGVKKKTETGELKIEEIKITNPDSLKFPSSAGDGWAWIKEKSIWSDRPINIETKGQSPIFYDKFYSKVYYSGKNKPEINDLPDGMIRVIGRYLGKTIDNKVQLFTEKENGISDTINIQVIRPSRLGEDILNITGPTKIDYVDSTYNNIDSLLINISGDLGIPPQFLMGIVEQESPNGLGYRYEPFSDMLERKKFRNKYPTHRYWIESEINLGSPTIPHHNNLKDALGPINNYPGYTTVWEIFNEKNKGKNKMYTLNVYYWYKDDFWNPYQKYYYEKLKDKGLDTLVAADSSRVLADTSYVIFLRDSIGGVGMKGTVAQTRIFASYGFMQLVYSSAITAKYDYSYPNNDPDFLPEYIMIPTINIPYASKHLLGKLRDVLGKVNYLEADTWPKEHAFEKSYWEAFRSYNGSGDYPNKVFNHIKDNLPKKY